MLKVPQFSTNVSARLPVQPLLSVAVTVML
jgi:hypothetical protein